MTCNILNCVPEFIRSHNVIVFKKYRKIFVYHSLIQKKNQQIFCNKHMKRWWQNIWIVECGWLLGGQNFLLFTYVVYCCSKYQLVMFEYYTTQYPKNNLKFFLRVNLLSANFTKWSNTLKQFLRCCRRIVWLCLTILWDWRFKG